MAYTSHGHYIPHTIETLRPALVKACGGPLICGDCTEESKGVADREMESIYGRPYSPPEVRK